MIREYKAELYQIGSWYLAKNVSELPQQVVVPLIGFVPAYFMIGIGHGFAVYLQMQLVVILLYSVSVGLGYMVACMCRRVEIAPIVGTVIMLPFLLPGGLFVNTENKLGFLSWLAYISLITYSFKAFMKIFWADVPSIPCDDNTATTAAAVAEGVVCLARSRAEVLRNYSVDDHALALDLVTLVALNAAFRVLRYLVLVVNLKRDK